MSSIFCTRPVLPELSEYIAELSDIWDSHILTNMGEKHKAFETALKEYTSSRNVSLFCNGHIALETAIRALNLKGEVITVPFTFASTANALIRTGIKPTFCDIKASDFTIDTELIERLITPETTAILAVHVYGNICDYEAIDRIAEKYQLKVIYDAAHAFGVKLSDADSIAELGDISMFSFHATKVFHSIEGGALFYRDVSHKRAIDLDKNFGIESEDSLVCAGGNGKMNEFSAAMGLCNLRHLDYNIKERENVYLRYTENLSGVKGIQLNKEQKLVLKSNFAYFPVVFSSQNIRDRVYNSLKHSNIYARKYFYPAVNEHSYISAEIRGNTPVAHEISTRILTLPIYHSLDLSTVDYICKTIKDEIL